jgi:hypothetical protein
MTLTCVDNAISDREVDRRKQQDRFDQEHLERAKNRTFEDGTGGPVDALVLCVDFLILLGIRLA